MLNRRMILVLSASCQTGPGWNLLVSNLLVSGTAWMFGDSFADPAKFVLHYATCVTNGPTSALPLARRRKHDIDLNNSRGTARARTYAQAA